MAGCRAVAGCRKGVGQCDCYRALFRRRSLLAVADRVGECIYPDIARIGRCISKVTRGGIKYNVAVYRLLCNLDGQRVYLAAGNIRRIAEYYVAA